MLVVLTSMKQCSEPCSHLQREAKGENGHDYPGDRGQICTRGTISKDNTIPDAADSPTRWPPDERSAASLFASTTSCAFCSWSSVLVDVSSVRLPQRVLK